MITDPAPTSKLRDNLAQVRARMREACARAGRAEGDVRLVVVSKFRPVEEIRQVIDLGERVHAENRVQEAREKVSVLPPDVEWHLIGRLQSNKAKYLPGLVQRIHSLDREDLAEALEKAFSKAGQRVRVLLQVSLAGEEQKGGVEPEKAEALARFFLEKCPSLSLEGLMTMPPYSDHAEASRPLFRELRELRGRLQDSLGHPLPDLSMGMSNDYEVAIEEGATMVRVGSAIYEGP